MRKGLWIPNEILRLDSLNITERYVLSVIFSFASGSKGVCTARNSTIAEAGRMSVSTVNHTIPTLISKGFLIKKGRVQNRVLSVNLSEVTTAESATVTTAESATHSCKSCNTLLQNLQYTTAESAEAFIKIKERDKERYKEGVYIAPAEIKNEEGDLINDEGRNEEEHEQFLHDFWCKELGL